MTRLSSRAFYGTSPSFNARAAAIPFAHTKPRAHVHRGVWWCADDCTRCIQLRQEINLREHVMRARV